MRAASHTSSRRAWASAVSRGRSESAHIMSVDGGGVVELDNRSDMMATSGVDLPAACAISLPAASPRMHVGQASGVTGSGSVAKSCMVGSSQLVGVGVGAGAIPATWGWGGGKAPGGRAGTAASGEGPASIGHPAAKAGVSASVVVSRVVRGGGAGSACGEVFSAASPIGCTAGL